MNGAAAHRHEAWSTQMLVSPGLREWASGEVRRLGAKLKPLPRTRRRKLLIIHLDGVPRALLEEAVRARTMPFFSRLVQSGAYTFDGAFWGSPSSTPFFQAGLLYGLRHPNLPAYSWFDRELKRKVIMNAPADALAIEERLGRREGASLLSEGGHTYFSLFRAEAKNRLCMSSLASLKVAARSLRYEVEGLWSARAPGLLRHVASFAQDVWKAGQDMMAWARAVEDWRHERELLLSRVLLQRLGWSFAHTKTRVDMVRGVPAIYLVFGNFDEVAHRRGPRSPQATAELYRVDAQLAELYALAKTLEEPYDVIFLTDHGHVDSEPLEKRRGGVKLEQALFEGPPLPVAEQVARALRDGRACAWENAEEGVKPVVIEAGNFAHVYLTGGARPLEAAEILARFPHVLARATAHPDIGLTAVRRGDSAVAVIQGGVYGPDEVAGAPLPTEFSRRAVEDFLRELPHMSTAGDLVVFGEAVRRGTTVGFAWEFGSHGGLTRSETESVICWPTDAPLNLGGLSHCAELHERLSEVYRG